MADTTSQASVSVIPGPGSMGELPTFEVQTKRAGSEAAGDLTGMEVQGGRCGWKRQGAPVSPGREGRASPDLAGTATEPTPAEALGARGHGARIARLGGVGADAAGSLASRLSGGQALAQSASAVDAPAPPARQPSQWSTKRLDHGPDLSVHDPGPVKEELEQFRAMLQESEVKIRSFSADARNATQQLQSMKDEAGEDVGIGLWSAIAEAAVRDRKVVQIEAKALAQRTELHGLYTESMEHASSGGAPPKFIAMRQASANLNESIASLEAFMVKARSAVQEEKDEITAALAAR